MRRRGREGGKEKLIWHAPSAGVCNFQINYQRDFPTKIFQLHPLSYVQCSLCTCTRVYLNVILPFLSPERVRCGVDIVLHPGFSLAAHARPVLMRQQSKMTKVVNMNLPCTQFVYHQMFYIFHFYVTKCVLYIIISIFLIMYCTYVFSSGSCWSYV